MSGEDIGNAGKYIAQSSAYNANTATDNVKAAGGEVAKAGSYISDTTAGNKNLQGELAGGVAQSAKNAEMAQQTQAQNAAIAEAKMQIEAAKADTLANQDNALRSQARAAQTAGLAGNILTGGRGVRRGDERTSRVLLGA